MRSRFPMLAASILPLVAGCYTFTPDRLGATPPALSRHWQAPVSITAAHRPNPVSRFNPSGYSYEANLDDFSDELARLLRESLQKAGNPIAPGYKTVEVQVVYIDFMFQGPCLVDFDTRLGNGEVFGLQATGESALFDRACRAAFESAVSQIAGDPRTAAYLGAP